MSAEQEQGLEMESKIGTVWILSKDKFDPASWRDKNESGEIVLINPSGQMLHISHPLELLNNGACIAQIVEEVSENAVPQNFLCLIDPLVSQSGNGIAEGLLVYLESNGWTKLK